jgi:hypothetical protein
MMTANSFCSRSLRGGVLVLLFSAAAYSASAQVVPGMRTPPNISLFGTFTAVKPNTSSYGDFAVYGFSAGGFLQLRHLVGVEVRGSLQRSQGLEHQESALAGPRFAMHFGHISPYVSVLGGVANAWRWSRPPVSGQPWPQLYGGFGPEWSVVGGLDVHLTRHMVMRMGEVSYSKIYLKDWNATPLGVGAGLVFRLD